MNDFTCEICSEIFNKIPGWDALKEYVAAPWYIPGADVGVVCDDCFEEVKEWFSKLTPEEHERIRNE